MLRALTVALVLQCCDICVPIRVPVAWDGDSAVQTFAEEPKTSADKIQPHNLQQPVPVEYFEYTAQKPQFAVDVAKFHGVESPQEHYKARPVRPYTGKKKPELGIHRIQDPNRPVFTELQQYINKDADLESHAKPVSSNYEVFHPYKAEEPGFQELYKDPVLDKIRNDIRDSSQRLQTYENEAGKPNIESGEYLETLDETDRKKIPQRNIPAPYEIHRPQRRPVYYRAPPKYPNRNQILNQRFRHPWNQNFVKIRPAHYVPLQNHLQRLRQNHALKYDDERNEYPQIPVQQHYEEPSDGYDIFEKGKQKYVNLRNNLDESINNIAKESRPSAPQKLELQSNEEPEPDEEDEFVPIKNYAQVRKTETTKHLPKSAAFDDADTFEEIKNAPRLREAIKSTKAQTVYTEEGYEDSAYDHAGEQKHASDHEAHAGYLKEKEKSGGNYKIPSVSGSFENGQGSAYRDQIIHGKKWEDDNKDSNKEEESADYDEDEHEQYIEADNYRRGPANKRENQRNKRGDDTKGIEKYKDIDHSESVDDTKDSENINTTNIQHDVNKRETNDFKVPEIKLDPIFTADKEILEVSKQKLLSEENLKEKYPYYFKNIKALNEHSPLRYAENLKFIPKKSKGGTEFYDSRSRLECPEVDDKVDAIPEKLKKNGHPDEDEEGSDEEKSDKKTNNKGEAGPVEPRLAGLGDKIDCFKAKYFGENPLDSPFFREELISNPEPITLPTSTFLKLKESKDTPILNTASSDIIINAEKLRNDSKSDIFDLLNKLNNDRSKLLGSASTESEDFKSFASPSNVTFSDFTTNFEQKNIYSDILKNIKHNLNHPFPDFNKTSAFTTLKETPINSTPKTDNNTYASVENKDDTTSQTEQSVIITRKKRASPFVYEPYKIIRDVQNNDSKKTTTTGNISPLIKQLQSSKVIDAVVKVNQPVKRTTNTRIYKDIGRKDREKKTDLTDHTDASFIDVNSDKRRGEPRYELRPSNHKSQYSPVNNKKSMSVEDYEAQTKQKIIQTSKNDKPGTHTTNLRSKTPSPRAMYDISKFLPKPEEIQRSAASNTVKTTVTTSATPTTRKDTSSSEVSDESEEDYDEEYDDEEEEEEDTQISTTTTTTTTTTPKPHFRRRIRSTTTTTEKEEEITEEPPKLRLVTRFHTTPPPKRSKPGTESHTKSTKKYDESEESPKYREKKKKSTQRTVVTDTKKYGDDDDDDMGKEEIDALIGVKHDMDEYMPMYEKEAERKNKQREPDSSEEDDDESEEDEDEDDDEDDEEDDIEEEDEEEEVTTPKPVITTTEAPKRTLARTTDTPPSTTETRIAKLEAKPVVTKKKIEIHKELPVNKSSPHITQYKQDIEEEEVIKEIPRKVPKTPEIKKNKNLELLDLYKDENLAKDINQLGGVEVFKENLDFKAGPKHGGNYRRAPDAEEELEVTTSKPTRRRTPKPAKDAVTSETENKKLIELNEDIPTRKLHGGNLKSVDDFKRSRGSAKSEKLVELTTEPTNTRAMHGGNLKSIRDRGGKRFEGRSAKLIELDDSGESDEDDSSDGSMHGGNFKTYGSRSTGRGSRLHGGNYKSAKLVAAENEKGETKSLAETSKTNGAKNARVNSADLLNSFAQAAPILTSTPAPYILDPSKRMYYYVD